MSLDSLNTVHSKSPSFESSSSLPSSPATVIRTSSRSLHSRRRPSTNSPTPLPRRESLAALLTSTAVDPRLQENPHHTLGPWPLSRKVSSNGSSSGSSERSRANSTFSQSASLSPPLVEAKETFATVTNQKVEFDQLGTAELEETVSQHGFHVDSPSERAIIRDIFTIHDFSEEKNSDLPKAKTEEPWMSILDPVPIFPESYSYSEEEPLVICKIVSNDTHACDDLQKLKLSLKVSNGSHLLAHLQPGDEVQIAAAAPVKRTLVTRGNDGNDLPLVHEGADTATLPKHPQHPWLQQLIAVVCYTGVSLAFHEMLLMLLCTLLDEGFCFAEGER